MENISYLCGMKQMHITMKKPRVFGRTELAAKYFPYITPQAAWRKLRMLMADSGQLSALASDKSKRCFLPAETKAIFDVLGDPTQ